MLRSGRHSYALAALLAATFLLSLPAAAQPQPLTSPSGDDSTATIYVITRDEILARGYGVLTDVLRDLPGLEIIEHYYSEVGTLVPVRGVTGNNKIVLLINGMRVNPPGGEELMLRRDVSVRDADRIEVRYGPGSTLYGEDAISAVINIVTRTPEGRADGQVFGGLGTHGTQDAYVSFGGQAGPAGAPVAVSGFAQVYRSDLTRLDLNYPQWWTQYSQSPTAGQLPAQPFRAAHGTNLFLRAAGGSGSVQAWYRESSRSSAEGGYAPIVQFVPEGVWRDRSLVLEGRHRLSLTDALHVDSSLIYNRYEVDPETRYVFPVDGALFYDDFKYALGSGLRAEEKLDYRVSSRLSLVTGFVASLYEITPKATIPGGARTTGDVIQQGGAFTYYTQRGNAASRVDLPRATHLSYQAYGAYGQAQYAASAALKVIVGVRFDRHTRYSDKPFSPRVAVTYAKSGSAFTYRYSYARAFLSPGPYFGFNVYDNGVSLNGTNPDLQPERADSNELNVTWKRNQIEVGAAGFWNQQENLLLIGDLGLPVNIVSPAVYLDVAGTQARVLTRTANGGENTTRGLDLYTRATRAAGTLWASYSVVDGSTNLAGAPGLNGISRHNLRLGTTWKVTPTLWITPSLVVRSTPEGVQAPVELANQVRTPYDLYTYVRYAPVPRFEAFLQARNLTNHKYALRGILAPTPQETATALTGIRVSF
jgi:outer membrane receptor protein involved in Fe transport